MMKWKSKVKTTWFDYQAVSTIEVMLKLQTKKTIMKREEEVYMVLEDCAFTEMLTRFWQSSTRGENGLNVGDMSKRRRKALKTKRRLFFFFFTMNIVQKLSAVVIVLCMCYSLIRIRHGYKTISLNWTTASVEENRVSFFLYSPIIKP